jgi:hypothetical protein
MCPECIPEVAMTVAGAGSISSVVFLSFRRLIRNIREKTFRSKSKGELQ